MLVLTRNLTSDGNACQPEPRKCAVVAANSRAARALCCEPEAAIANTSPARYSWRDGLRSSNARYCSTVMSLRAASETTLLRGYPPCACICAHECSLQLLPINGCRDSTSRPPAPGTGRPCLRSDWPELGRDSTRPADMSVEH